MIDLIYSFNLFLWNGFLIYLFVFVGIFLTFRLKGLQFRYFFTSLKISFSRKERGGKGDITPFQSLMTSLAATIGIGSITGMATALVKGGFGAMFWMWVVSLLGLIIKYSEALLAVRFRSQDCKNEICGGPMHYIEKGLGFKKLASSFALFGALAAFFGGNMTQAHSIGDCLFELFSIPTYFTAGSLSLLVSFVILGGVKNLARVNSFLVPFMGLFYLFAGLLIVFVHIDQVPSVFSRIFQEAFYISNVVKGVGTAGFIYALQMGVVRGICSNEAGLGSSPIAAAASKTNSSVRVALISMTGVFLSTFIVCTLTVFVIGVTGVYGSVNYFGEIINGAPLVMKAFETTIPYGNYVVTIGILLFGYSTILGWSYYGEKCIEYLLGGKSIKIYRVIFIAFVFLGPLLSLELVWALVDVFNGLMALPNLLALFLLSPILDKESKRFSLLFEKRMLKA